nr:SIR2 family protein [Roseovarius sp. W115]MDV2928079.1 SIR2 family protein [Roseovarius sp. W115]
MSWHAEIKFIDGPKFVPSFWLRPSGFAWLLGAGASASAGIPTGYDMITDFKKQLFCQLSGTSRKQVDCNDPLWMERIDLLLESRSALPPPGDPMEYAAAFEAVYPTPEERRAYIDHAVTKGTPSFAHRALAAMITRKSVPCVFTTNFDAMIETATTVTDQLFDASERANLTVAGIDNAARAALCIKESRWPLLAKMHGDYQSVELKNTTEELASQDREMRHVLTNACTRFGLIIVGYSGRDQSVMSALTDALTTPNAYPTGIVWTCRSAKHLLPAVIEFLNAAADAGVSVSVVETQTFDELAADLLDGTELPDVLAAHVLQARPAEVNQMVPIPSGDRRAFPVLQSSAVPIIEMPEVARRIKLNKSITTQEAQMTLKASRKTGIVASVGHELAAFGRDEDLLAAFSDHGAEIAGTIELNIVDESWAMGLVYDALVHAICRTQPILPRLRRSGHVAVFAHGRRDENASVAEQRKNQQSSAQSAYGSALTGRLPNQSGFFFNEGIRIKLDRVVDRWWCAFEPATFVKTPRTDDPNQEKKNRDIVVDWTRERWARRYNNVWSKIISAWVPLIAGNKEGRIQACGIQKSDGVDAEFLISSATAWSRPSHDHAYFQRR